MEISKNREETTLVSCETSKFMAHEWDVKSLHPKRLAQRNLPLVQVYLSKREDKLLELAFHHMTWTIWRYPWKQAPFAFWDDPYLAGI